ncbi:PAS domain S-box-containing protein/diguanylate cyclase (GGDEF) domain-containing protein [Methylobacterium gossipiicola]|uniref:diguanylate cyclase n=2 Tax=Methylobacterium gossipiicola TaxID=582675 RepID=A0A1I2XAL7_9HYPH|nr:PAS domain S-box-containing protein/diguanylate cyclase (GGDEF) domain-containing protein [Methylobacterium gossipiicola]
MGAKAEPNMTEDAESRAYRLMLTQVTIEKLNDLVIWLDEAGRYVFVNPATTRLLGYTAEELTRLHVWDVDPLFDEARWRQHWAEVVERKSFTLETVNRSKAGVDITIEVSSNFVEYEGRRFNCAIVRDITERHRLDKELRDLNETIYRLSITDSLTGLANRRHFDAVLAQETERHGRSGAPLSLVLLDLDAFKALNDLYGHVVGDDALRIIAATLQGTMHRASITARYGGEEFVCILPETSHAEALDCAEATRAAIAALAVPHTGSPVADHVTASFGVATTETGAMRTVDLLRAADDALYRAKNLGRNRVVGRETP